VGSGGVGGMADHRAFSCGPVSISWFAGVVVLHCALRASTRFLRLMAKKARIAMRMTETEHATPMAMPRLMPGSARSVCRAVSSRVNDGRDGGRVDDELWSVAIVSRYRQELDMHTR